MAKCGEWVWRLCWALAVVGVLALWVFHSGYFCRWYAHFGTKTSSELKFVDKAPMPSVVLCSGNPLNKSALTAAVMLNRNVMRYMRQWYEPQRWIADGAERGGPLDAQWSHSTVRGVEAYFGAHLQQKLGTLRNKTGYTKFIYDCESIVKSCSTSQSTEGDEYDCCSKARYIPTAKGLCLVMKTADYQTSPLDKPLVLRVGASANAYKAQNAGGDELQSFDFDVYFVDEHVVDGDNWLDAYGSLNTPALRVKGADNTAYSIALELIEVEDSRYRLDEFVDKVKAYSKPLNDAIEGLDLDSINSDERVLHCLVNKVHKDCDCVPTMDFWTQTLADNAAEESLCSLNDTIHCVYPILRTWARVQQSSAAGRMTPRTLTELARRLGRLSDSGEGDHKSMLRAYAGHYCWPKKGGSKYEYQWKVTDTHAIGAASGDVSSSFELRLHFPLIAARHELLEWDMDIALLLTYILFAFCAWYFLLLLAYMCCACTVAKWCGIECANGGGAGRQRPWDAGSWPAGKLVAPTDNHDRAFQTD